MPKGEKTMTGSPKVERAAKPEPTKDVAKALAKAADPSPAVLGLLNNRAAIHEDIRKMARKMEIEPPSLDAIKKNMYVPPAEDVSKESEAGIAKLLKEVKVIGGDSGKKSKSHKMTDADAACYSSRYSDLADKPAKEHFRLTGEN